MATTILSRMLSLLGEPNRTAISEAFVPKKIDGLTRDLDFEECIKLFVETKSSEVENCYAILVMAIILAKTPADCREVFLHSKGTFPNLASSAIHKMARLIREENPGEPFE